MMSRIEIPIPQPPPPEVEPNRPPQFSFHEREDGTVEVVAETLQDHIAAFRNVTEDMDDHFWAQAAVAASATKKYGHGAYGKKRMQQLSEAVELSTGYLHKMARTYRTFTENYPREHNLIFAKHLIACGHVNPGKAARYAVEHPMSCRDFENWVSSERQKRAKKITKERQRAARTEFLDHLEHVESVIENDFIKGCPIKDYARRVYEQGWLAEIKFELRQFLRKANDELIRAAIDDDGRRTIDEIRDATSLSKSDIEACIGQLIASGEYDWVRRGGKKDNERGQGLMILHKVGTAIGT
jgi:acylphosphatase